MPNVTAASIEAAIIEYVAPGVENLTFNFDDPLVKKIEKGKHEELNSRGASMVIQPLNNESEQWGTAEFADYPTPGNSPLVKVTVPFVGVTASVLFSHLVMEENENATAIADLVQGQIDNKIDALNQSREFLLWGDGSGERARVSAFNNGTGVVTCNNSGNLYGAQMVGQGAYVEFRDSAGVLKSGGGATYGLISTKDNGALTFTLDATVGYPNDVANGDRVYLRGSYATAPRGFLYHVANSGAWQGLADRTIYPGTNPALIDASSQVLSAALMDKMKSAGDFKRRSTKMGNFKFYVSSQREAYLNTGYELKSYVNSTDLKGGFTNLTHAGVPIEWHPFAQRNMVWALDIGFMRYFRWSKIDWVKNAAGGVFHLLNAAQGQMHASGRACYLEGRMNYGVRNPVKLGTRLHTLATTGLDLGNNT